MTKEAGSPCCHQAPFSGSYLCQSNQGFGECPPREHATEKKEHLNYQLRESLTKIWVKNHPDHKKPVYTKPPIRNNKKKLLGAIFQHRSDAIYCKISLSSISLVYLPLYLCFGWRYIAFCAIYSNVWALYQLNPWRHSGENKEYITDDHLQKIFPQPQQSVTLSSVIMDWVPREKSTL